MTKEMYKEKEALKKELEKQETIALKLKCRELIDALKRYDVSDYSHLLDINEELAHVKRLCDMKCNFIENVKESYNLKDK